MLNGCRGGDFETTQFEEKVCSAKPSIFYSALRRPQQNLFIISNIHHLAISARQSTAASSLYSHKKSRGSPSETCLLCFRIFREKPAHLVVFGDFWYIYKYWLLLLKTKQRIHIVIRWMNFSSGQCAIALHLDLSSSSKHFDRSCQSKK